MIRVLRRPGSFAKPADLRVRQCNMDLQNTDNFRKDGVIHRRFRLAAHSIMLMPKHVHVVGLKEVPLTFHAELDCLAELERVHIW